MEGAATTASSLEAKQDSEAQIRFEATSKQSNDPPLSRVNTLGSGEGSMKLKELMDFCTKLSDRVLALENTNTSQAAEIATLKERVKKLEKKRRSRTYKPRRLYKGRKIADLDADIEVTLIDETQGRNDEDLMFNTGVLNGDEIQRISLTGFPAQSVGSSNTYVSDSPCLLVLITGTSQSRQHGKSESNSYYLSDLVFNSFTRPKLISSYHKLDSYRILQVTYQELVCCWLKQDFHLHCEYLSITRMFWQDLKDNA
ncbi:hypothetical protein Tco_0108817 [Tanacetum coccineum]